jgi:hypothetical protein
MENPIMKKELKELDLDLDLALEEVARKLKPVANGECGFTAVPSNAYHTKGQTCGCPCCSTDSPSACRSACPI